LNFNLNFMENWKEKYPYVEVKRVRQFEDEFEISDVIPPTVLGKTVEFQTVFCALEDAKRALFNKCRRGHRLNAVKLSPEDVRDLIDQVQNFIYSNCR